MSAGFANSYPYWLGTVGTSAGISQNAVGEQAIVGSNTTITNSLVTANSVILITPYSTAGGLSGAPAVTSRTAGSFVVNWPNYPSGTKSIMYLIAKS